jgi:hypothetical protein
MAAVFVGCKPYRLVGRYHVLEKHTVFLSCLKIILATARTSELSLEVADDQKDAAEL